MYLLEALVEKYGLVISIVPAFAATFVGVFLAYYLAARQERNKRKTEEAETKEKIKTALANELSVIKASLDEAVRLKTEGKIKIDDIPHVDLAIDAKESAVSSGKFSLLESGLQLEVSHIYAVIRRAQGYLSQMMDFVASPALALSHSNRMFRALSINFWGQVEHLQEHIPVLIQKLQGKDQEIKL